MCSCTSKQRLAIQNHQKKMLLHFHLYSIMRYKLNNRYNYVGKLLQINLQKHYNFNLQMWIIFFGIFRCGQNEH